MTDAPKFDETATKRFEVSRFVVMSGWIVMILTCFIIILAATYSAMMNTPVQEFLINNAQLALGFLFGTFATLVRDFAISKNGS